MVGLDVTLKVVMTKNYLDKLGNVGNPATELIRQVLPFYQQFHMEEYGLNGDLHTHDPSAIAYLLDPALFQAEQIPAFVETVGSCSGQTVLDRQRQLGDFKEINVCLGVDDRSVLDLFWERLTG
jgi:inosine-uridine nucleoside N-ribohydrolase